LGSFISDWFYFQSLNLALSFMGRVI